MNDTPTNLPPAGDGDGRPVQQNGQPEGAAPVPAPGRRIRGRAPAADAEVPPPVRARRGNGGSGNGADATEAVRGAGRGRPRGNGGNGGNGGGGGDATGVLPMRRLLTAMRALRAGDFTVRLPESSDPLVDEIFETFNEIASTNDRVSREMT
ncbi:MAG TPA: HAMP domain-containing protein, partial [Longimicrobium sp.]